MVAIEHTERDRRMLQNNLQAASYDSKSARKHFHLAGKSGLGAFACRSWRSNRAHIIGVVVNEMTNETRMAVERVTANSRNNRPTIPPMSRIGVKTATSERLIERTVNPTSRAPLSAASRPHPLLEMARNIFDHDDCVIDHKPGRNGQRHQRKIVEAVAAQIHHAERANQ